MAKDLFSINIQDDLVCGVLIHQTQKSSSISGYGVACVGSRSIKDALVEVMEQIGVRGGVCRVSFPAEHFFFRNVTLPFADIRKIRKVLPFELEESAPLEIDKLMVDALSSASGENASAVVAVMIQREYLAERLAMLLDLGLDPEIITVSGVQTAVRLLERSGCPPDFILLDVGLKWARMIVIQDKQVTLIRPLALNEDGFVQDFQSGDNLSGIQPRSLVPPLKIYQGIVSSITQTLAVSKIGRLPLYLTGPIGEQAELAACIRETLGVETKCCDLLRKMPAIKVTPEVKNKWIPCIMDQALALGLRPVRSKKWLNFRKDEFAKKLSLNQYHRLIPRIVGVTTLLLMVIGFSLWLNYLSAKREEKNLTVHIRSVFSETLPDISRIVDPIQQLQVEINSLKQVTSGGRISSNYGVLDILAEISRSIPATLHVRLTLMVVDDKGVRLKGMTDNFNTVDNIKKNLEKSSYFNVVTISSANLAPKGNEIRFEIRLQLNRT